MFAILAWWLTIQSSLSTGMRGITQGLYSANGVCTATIDTRGSPPASSESLLGPSGRWRQSICAQYRPNISYLRWRLDYPRRPPESHSIAATEPTRAPPSLPAARIARPISCSSTYALHLPDSPRKYLTSGTLQTLVDSTQIPTLSSLNGIPARE